MDYKTPKSELDNRMASFCNSMNKTNPTWDTAIIVSKVNQFYFTGTMQDGFLVIKKNQSHCYFVRRSFERAKDESYLDNIVQIENFRDAAAVIGSGCGNTYFETEIIPIGYMDRLKKCFNFDNILSLDRIVLTLRSVKSAYELFWIEKSGESHKKLLEEEVPKLLREGMSEADLAGECFAKMISLGYQGISRFSMFQAEMVVGQIGFGESSLYPTNFDGPGGGFGMYPAVPLAGSRERKLKKNDLVFVDIAFGINGYHSDKTGVYCFGAKPSFEIKTAHQKCLDIMQDTAQKLICGNIPANIYNEIISNIDDEFLKNFMGHGSRRVKFLGHGVGLHIDEYPVIANGFKEPLQENMVISLEPKYGITNVGMVGAEETFIVTKNGARCVTGGSRKIIEI